MTPTEITEAFCNFKKLQDLLHKKFVDLKVVNIYDPDFNQYIAEAVWALENQWHDIKSDLPYKDKKLTTSGYMTYNLLCLSDKNEILNDP